MYTLTTKCGKQLLVSESVYNALKNEYLNDTWECRATIDGSTYSFTLYDNFKGI